MQTDGDGINQYNRADTLRQVAVVEDVSCYDGTIRVGDQDEFLIRWEILVEDLGDLSTGLLAR